MRHRNLYCVASELRSYSCDTLHEGMRSDGLVDVTESVRQTSDEKSLIVSHWRITNRLWHITEGFCDTALYEADNV